MKTINDDSHWMLNSPGRWETVLGEMWYWWFEDLYLYDPWNLDITWRDVAIEKYVFFFPSDCFIHLILHYNFTMTIIVWDGHKLKFIFCLFIHSFVLSGLLYPGQETKNKESDRKTNWAMLENVEKKTDSSIYHYQNSTREPCLKSPGISMKPVLWFPERASSYYWCEDAVGIK